MSGIELLDRFLDETTRSVAEVALEELGSAFDHILECTGLEPEDGLPCDECEGYAGRWSSLTSYITPVAKLLDTIADQLERDAVRNEQ